MLVQSYAESLPRATVLMAAAKHQQMAAFLHVVLAISRTAWMVGEAFFKYESY
jgi:hypothetical protein